jgi:hypothetical protein
MARTTGPRRPGASCFVAAVVAAALSIWPSLVRAEPGDELTVSVLTFGPGDHPFSKFGHDGLLVEDRVLGTSLVYNYGTYSFRSAWLIPKFLLGKYRYWLSVSPLPSVVASYAAENRSVVLQRLALGAAQKRSLVEFLTWNAREENKYYLFDYYRDNCATRVRDLIDGATDGALHAATNKPATLTWREHTERLVADDPLVYFGLDLAMGGLIDQPIAFWQEMFLPAKLEEGLRGTLVGVLDGSGSTVIGKLVDREIVLVESQRPPLRASPPPWTMSLLGAGSLAALFLAAVGWAVYLGNRAARIGLGLAIAVLGLLLGSLGCLFLFLWIFTNHEVAYRNENLLQCVPFALLLVAPGTAMALGKPGSAARAHRTAIVALGCSSAGLVLKILPWFYQRNLHLIAFFLPLWVGVALATKIAAWRSGERPRDDHRLAMTQARGIEGT